MGAAYASIAVVSVLVHAIGVVLWLTILPIILIGSASLCWGLDESALLVVANAQLAGWLAVQMAGRFLVSAAGNASVGIVRRGVFGAYQKSHGRLLRDLYARARSVLSGCCALCCC